MFLNSEVQELLYHSSM